jgi:hypothetical protein
MTHLNFSPRLIGVALRPNSSQNFLADQFDVAVLSLFLRKLFRIRSPKILQFPGGFVPQAKLLQVGWRNTRQGTTDSLQVRQGE